MAAMSTTAAFRPFLSPALARRITLARRHLPQSQSQSQTYSVRSLNTSIKPRASTIPPPTALSALLSRLSLPPSTSLHSALLACLTHPSYVVNQDQDREELEVVSGSGTEQESSSSTVTVSESRETNAILSPLGNSLLGLFASEHLATIYPLLPTSALASAISAYVGPASCASIARELGVSVQGGGNSNLPGQGAGSQSSGVPIRWSRTNLIEQYWQEKKGRIERQSHTQPPTQTQSEKVPVGRRFQKFVNDASGGAQEAVNDLDGRRVKKESFEDVVADTVRAFVGLIYQEQGIHSARAFVHAHFLSRALDLSTIISPSNPMHLLTSVVSKHLSDAGVSINSNEGIIQRRLLASTGIQSQSPLFLIGLFLPSGIKLAEGHGSSKKMAEHRAATNALHSLFLVRGDKPSSLAGEFGVVDLRVFGNGNGNGLPTSIHKEKLLQGGQVVRGEKEDDYVGKELGGKDVLPGSSVRRRR